MTRLSALALLVSLALGLASPVRADVVELLTGQRVTGKVERLTPTTIVIQRQSGTVVLGRDTVRTIYLDATPVPEPPRHGLVQDALEALTRLEATNRNVIAFADSAARLRAAQAAVARYLASLEPAQAGSASGVRDAVVAALQYLSLASTAMQPLTDSQLAAIGRDAALESCSHLQEVLQRDLGRFTSSDVSRNRGMAVSLFGITELWTCAAEKIAEAKQLLKAEE